MIQIKTAILINVDLKNLNLNEIKNLDNFSGIVPVFPLSTVVFFPNTLLPLHIFEPRYRDMLSDSLNTEKIIAMALLKPGWEKDYYGTPEVYEVAGMGRIVSSETFNDGKSNIVLYGLKRIRILEFVDNKTYRRARIEILENLGSADETGHKDKILKLISDWNDLLGTRYKKHKLSINSALPLENITDVLASVLITNIIEKQHFLEETDVGIRAGKLTQLLETKLKSAFITSRRKDSIVNTRNLN